jgi:hypothetical protein
MLKPGLQRSARAVNIVIRPLHQLARVALVLAVSFAAINISQPALAQAPAADAARAHKVALIDMAVIFKQYKKLRKQLFRLWSHIQNTKQPIFWIVL